MRLDVVPRFPPAEVKVLAQYAGKSASGTWPQIITIVNLGYAIPRLPAAGRCGKLRGTLPSNAHVGEVASRHDPERHLILKAHVILKGDVAHRASQEDSIRWTGKFHTLARCAPAATARFRRLADLAAGLHVKGFETAGRKTRLYMWVQESEL